VDLEAAHVGDVEHAGPLPHSLVFLNDAIVLHGHLPAREWHHARTEPSVLVEEGSAAECASAGFV
jgi:hypothetical protein